MPSGCPVRAPLSAASRRPRPPRLLWTSVQCTGRIIATAACGALSLAATGFSFNFDHSCVVENRSKLILIGSHGVRESRSLMVIIRTTGRCSGLRRKGRRRGQQPSWTGEGPAQGGTTPSARPPPTPPLTPLSPPARRIRAPQGRPAPSLPEVAGRTARGLRAHAPPADQPLPFSAETMNN